MIWTAVPETEPDADRKRGKPVTTRSRQAFVAVAFSAVAAAAVTGHHARGETKEAATVAEACRVYDWPKIPAECPTARRMSKSAMPPPTPPMATFARR